MSNKFISMFMALMLIWPPIITAGEFRTKIRTISALDPQFAVIRTDDAVPETDPFPSCAVKRDKFVWDKTTPYGQIMWELALRGYPGGVRVYYHDAACSFDGEHLILVRLTLTNRS